MALNSMGAPQVAITGDEPAKRVGGQASLETQGFQTASLKDGPAKRAVWVSHSGSEPREPTESTAVRVLSKPVTTAVVVDLGTGYCKCGFAGLPKPTHKISSTVGKPYMETSQTGSEHSQESYGISTVAREKPYRATLRAPGLPRPPWKGLNA
ncbi:hypothetical protein MC885_016369 [Smutsia gigantea]|nr:hypothetical protein MC885_016369 [Smutsia gigantea]